MRDVDNSHSVKQHHERIGSYVALAAADHPPRNKQLWRADPEYRLLFEENPLPMLVFDLETLSFLAVNKAAVHYYGYAREEFLSMRAEDICPPEEVPVLLDALSKTDYFDSSGKRRHRRADGTIIKVELLAHSLVFNGTPARLVIASDVTNRTRSEEALQRSLKEMNDIRSALDAASIVAITDQKGIITYVNDKFCEISKYSRAELLGQDHRIINSGYHSKEFIRDLWTTIAQGKLWRGEVRNRAKDGSLYWVDTTIVPFLDADRNPYQYVSIRNDITEYKQGEQAVLQMQAQLAHNEKIAELGRVAAQVAHEVRNPLAGLLLYSMHLKGKVGDKLPGSELQLIDKIIDTINQLTSTTEQILNFARPIKLTLQRIDLNRVIGDVLQLLELQIGTNKIELHLDLSESTPLGVVDEASIRAALLNLILNAIQAMPDGGRLTLASRTAGQVVSLSIIDTGCGIKEEQIDRAFEPFNTTKSRGLGLGMPYARKIVEQHGGTITVDSRIGEGTVVRIDLPAAEEQNESKGPPL